MNPDPIIILKAVVAVVALSWGVVITGLLFTNARRIELLEEAERARRLDECEPLRTELPEPSTPMEIISHE